MKKLTIRLSKEIMEQVNNNTLKTKTMIKYLLDNVEGATTKKAIDKTSMLDIDFSGKQAKMQ